MRRLLRLETATLALVLLAGLAAWAFFWIASEIAEGEAHALDTRLLLALRTPGDLATPVGPEWLATAMRDVTALGGVTILTFVTFATATALLLRGRRGTALLLLVATLGGQLLSRLAKIGFDRPRPDLVPHGVEVHSASFPSGHSMMAAVTYLTLGALLARVEPNPRLKLFYLALAVILTVAVGISRVYLGVHWPSDVAGGWAAGAAWALGCLLAARLTGRPAAPERRD